jgi:hypothetical protein
VSKYQEILFLEIVIYINKLEGLKNRKILMKFIKEIGGALI